MSASAIDVTVQRVTCPRHGEVFRASWPSGWPVFAASMLQTLLEDEGFRRETGGEVERIGKALDRKPACERVSREVLLHHYRDCGVGVQGACVVCHNLRFGTPYKTSTPAGVKDWTHICFECVLDQMRPFL